MFQYQWLSSCHIKEISMKRVLLLGNCHFTIARFRKELVCKLVEIGYDVWISFPNFSQGEKESGEEAAKRFNCNFIEFRLDRRNANPLKEIGTYRECKRILKTVKPDYVFTYTIKPNIYGGMAANSLNIPFAMNVTGLGSGFNKKVLSKLLFSLMEKNMKRAEKVFFQNNKDLTTFLDRGYKGDNCVLIPGSGVNLEEYRELPYPKETAKKEILYLARIMKEKGIAEYLKLAEQFADDPNIVFHICGDLEEDYREIIDEYALKNVIIYHGTVENVQEYLEKVCVVIHPSYYNEGISNSLLEAAASARPIITTDHPGCRDVVVEGVSGFLFEKKNAKDLIDKFQKFMNLEWDRREQMGLEGRKFVASKFDRNIVVNEYLTCLEEKWESERA